MEEEIVIIIKPKRAAMSEMQVHSFESSEEAYLFLGEHNDSKPVRTGAEE